MKKLIELTDVQRQYLIELISIDREVNGAIPIHDPEVPEEVDICDGVSNSFRGYLTGLLEEGLDLNMYKKINERYWTCGRIGKISDKIIP